MMAQKKLPETMYGAEFNHVLQLQIASTDSPYCPLEDPCIANLLMLAEWLDTLDERILLRIREDLITAEKGALTLYRFFNAIRNLYAPEFLLANV